MNHTPQVDPPTGQPHSTSEKDERARLNEIVRALCEAMASLKWSPKGLEWARTLSEHPDTPVLILHREGSFQSVIIVIDGQPIEVNWLTPQPNDPDLKNSAEKEVYRVTTEEIAHHFVRLRTSASSLHKYLQFKKSYETYQRALEDVTADFEAQLEELGKLETIGEQNFTDEDFAIRKNELVQELAKKETAHELLKIEVERQKAWLDEAAVLWNAEKRDMFDTRDFPNSIFGISV